ncbi:MAG: hypothetical protein ISP71_06400 [Flavobacteriales bacterium]|nr:hypothetical protein [Flavobacteriales bacterium]
MKKLAPYFFLILSFSSFHISAQSSNEFVRVTTVESIAELNAITSPYEGSLAFVENQNNIYQFDGLNWQTLGNSWSLDLNKNISPNNFLGTLDSNTIVFKSNDSTRMSINGEGQVMIDSRFDISENAAFQIGSGGSLPTMASDTTPFPYRIEEGPLNRAMHFYYPAEYPSGAWSTYPLFRQFPDHPPFHAFDDDPNTFWRFMRFRPQQNTTHYSSFYRAGLVVDFGVPTYIAGIKMTMGPNQNRAPVQVRLQGTNENPVVYDEKKWEKKYNPSTYDWHSYGSNFKWQLHYPPFYSTSNYAGPGPNLRSRSPAFVTNWNHADYANNREHTFLYESPLPHRYWLISFQVYILNTWNTLLNDYYVGNEPTSMISVINDTVLQHEYPPYNYNVNLQQRTYEISEIDFLMPSFTITKEGLTGISTTDPSHKLHVHGDILASGSITPDYVFEKEYEGKSDRKPDYVLLSLEEIERFVKERKHLPNVPSVSEVSNQGGVIVNQAVEKNLEKIEELYLHSFRLQKQIGELKARIQRIKKERLE